MLFIHKLELTIPGFPMIADDVAEFAKICEEAFEPKIQEENGELTIVIEGYEDDPDLIYMEFEQIVFSDRNIYKMVDNFTEETESMIGLDFMAFLMSKYGGEFVGVWTDNHALTPIIIINGEFREGVITVTEVTK